MFKKNLLALAIASITGVVFLPLAQADEQFQDNRWYVAPFGTFINTGGDRHADNGWGGGMGIGKILNEHFNVELRGFYQGFEGKGPNKQDWELAGGTADVQYFFNRNRLAPYAVLAVGGMNSSVGNQNVAGIIGEAGAGLTYEVSDNFLLRSDVRYRYNNNFNSHIQGGTDSFHDMTINVGFVIPFGAKPKATVANFEVPVAAAPVTDCSTLDSDADGVNDCLDQCLRTVKGSTVDNTGCPVKLVLTGQHFKFDSAELTLNAQEILDGVADSLISYPQNNDIEVQGHTSSEGSDAYNMRLSQRRAESVADYLRMKNVPNRLITKGYGESQPVADNSTEEGRAENRRAELIWIEY